MRAILTQNKIIEIIDFLDYDVFEDPTKYSSIIVIVKTLLELYRSFIESNFDPIECVRVGFWPEGEILRLIID